VTSLRTRLAIGALFWSIGLFSATTIVITMYPQLAKPITRVHQHGIIAALVAAFAMAGGFALVQAAVRPLERMRRRLAEVQAGSARQLDGRYPAEVQPLVDDLNALLAHRERALQRALAKAGDLAHGLKTPLAILSHEAEQAEASGGGDVAGAIREQVERMRRHVEYHLAHARASAAGASSGARCSVSDTVEGLSRALLRLNADRRVTLDVDVAADHTVRCQREDLEEMLGNLLDNAFKWGRSNVSVTAAAGDGAVEILVDDDGRGIDPALHDAVLQRGVRADQAAPGSGLGLAIVRDLAEVYGGTIALERSPSGGLRARLRLPAR
jgi:signal transduction histidine kinase